MLGIALRTFIPQDHIYVEDIVQHEENTHHVHLLSAKVAESTQEANMCSLYHVVLFLLLKILIMH